MRTIHVMGWAVVASSGCGRENVEGDDCSPAPVIQEVALDEPSVTGAVPLDVLERVNRTVSGRFDVSRVFREAGAPAALPGALSLAFTPSATPTDREAKPECNVGVHLNWPGRLDVGFVASDGSGVALDVSGLDAEVRASDPETIELWADAVFEPPGWLADLVATDPRFAPGPEVETMIYFGPWSPQFVLPPSLLSTEFGLSVRAPGTAVGIADWESDPAVGP